MVNKVDPKTGSNIDLNEYSKKIQDNPGMSTTDINKMLQDAGVDGDSFEAFYYIMTEVFMHQKGDAKEAEIEEEAQNLNELNEKAREWSDVKSYFFEGDCDTTYVAFTADLSDFLKDLLKKADPQSGSEILDIPTFLSIMDEIKQKAAGDPNYYNKNFPGIGSQILSITDSLQKISDNMGDLRNIWNMDDTSMAALKACEDGFSEIESQLTSISAGEGARIEYKNNEYNQLMGFVKGMLAEFQKVKQLALKNWVSR